MILLKFQSDIAKGTRKGALLGGSIAEAVGFGSRETHRVSLAKSLYDFDGAASHLLQIPFTQQKKKPKSVDNLPSDVYNIL